MLQARDAPAAEDSQGGPSFGGLPTEQRHAADREYERRTTQELVDLMNREDSTVPGAVAAARTEISVAIDAVVDRLATGGRLVYVGAGTSGRLSALDAAECESTFSSGRQVVALVAGADRASTREQDEVEDDAEAGAAAVRLLPVSSGDAVIGVSASGRTPYVLGAIAEAKRSRALTLAIVSNAGSELVELVDHAIVVAVGPEFLAGSTRLKSGTAQKLVLNTISTISMIRLGKTFGELMVDVRPANAKLRSRVQRIVATATGATAGEVDAALAAADGSAKVAIVSLLAGVDAETARDRLAAHDDNVRQALGS